MADIIKHSIIDLDPDEINYDDKEEVMKKFNELKEINKKLLGKKFRLQRKRKRLENKLARLMRKNKE